MPAGSFIIRYDNKRNEMLDVSERTQREPAASQLCSLKFWDSALANWWYSAAEGAGRTTKKKEGFCCFVLMFCCNWDASYSGHSFLLLLSGLCNKLLSPASHCLCVTQAGAGREQQA